MHDLLTMEMASMTEMSTPPTTPHAGTRTTTPRDLPTMYHFDLFNNNSANPNTIASEKQPEPTTPDDVSVQLAPCPICSRTFNPVTLRKHVGICEKMSIKKRNIFDSSRQRREGTELATYVLPKNFGLPNAATASGVHTPPNTSRAPERAHSPVQKVTSPVPQRRKSSNDELVRSTARTSIRKAASNAIAAAPQAPAMNPHTSQQTETHAAHPATGGGTAGGAGGNFTRDRMRSSERSVLKRTQQVASERCPHCDRSFGIKAYDRHVEWCKEKAIQATIKNSNSEQNKAKERLDARNKYRPPNLRTKRSINRDKYSGINGEDNECIESPKMVACKNSVMSMSLTSSVTSDRSPTKIPKPERSISNPKPLVAQRTLNFDMEQQTESVDTPTSSNTPPRRQIKAKSKLQTETFDKVKQSEHFEVTPYIPPHKRKINKMKSIKRDKIDNTDSGIKLPPMSQTKYQQINGIVNSKGELVGSCEIALHATRTAITKRGPIENKICQFNEDYIETTPRVPKSRSATALVRTARRQIRTKEYPSIELKAVQSKDKMKTRRKSREDEDSSLLKQIVTDDAMVPVSSSISLPMVYNFSQQSHRRAIHDATHDADTESPREVLTKLQTNSKTMTLCRPNKIRSNTRILSTKPLRAIPYHMDGALQQHTTANKSIGCGGNDDEDCRMRSGVRSEVAMGCRRRCLSGGRCRGDEISHEYESDDAVEVVVLEEMDNGIMVIKAPPNSFSRCSSPQQLQSGLVNDNSNKYDPFLSAKRQLEELCSPSSPNEPDLAELTKATTPTACANAGATTPALGIPNKMSTSLNLGSALTPQQQQQQSTTTPYNRSVSINNTKPSNFRRTSSLRGTRRAPILPSRPLFAHNYRPTIQRGLSDEGPISTNFLKPEEYDEMPVRSVCVNDFAITNSPRVVRRDTSASNRKQVQAQKSNIERDTGTGDRADAAPSATPKSISKTDSLAVFLKYEHELEKLSAANDAVVSQLSKELKDKSNTLSKQNSAKNLKLEIPKVATEEPKTTPTSCSQLPALQKISYPELVTGSSSTKENNENLCNNFSNTVRLEPISSSKPNTPLNLSKLPTTPLSRKSSIGTAPQSPQIITPTANKPRTLQLPTLGRSNTSTAQQPTQIQSPVNLNAIFGENNTSKPGLSFPGYTAKERKLSTGSDYIDPKLINKCDNLPVNLNHVLKSSDESSSSEYAAQPQLEQQPRSGADISQLSKLLPLSKQSPGDSLYSNSSSQSTVTHIAVEKRNSGEGRNLLKRKMRLGRNQFLYDASPEADSSCCSADDEANRSSMEYDEQVRNKIPSSYSSTTPANAEPNIHQQQSATHHRTTSARAGNTLSSIPPPLPIFDDFDFEEFLSSFEHDDEQFPLFKDCREFLMNRTSNKQRSMFSSYSNPNSKSSSNANTRPSTQATTKPNSLFSQAAQNLSPNCAAFPTAASTMTPIHFQFPNLITKSSTPLRSDSNASSTTSYQSSATGDDAQTHLSNSSYKRSHPSHRSSSSNEDKREIFISIETEQNEHGRSAISPSTLRHMVDNDQQSHMKLLDIDSNEHRFSKISDDDDDVHYGGGDVDGDADDDGDGDGDGDGVGGCTERLERSIPGLNLDETRIGRNRNKDDNDTTPPPPTTFQNQMDVSPNVQLNNAKNLIQKMQEDFRQMGEDLSANMRQAVNNGNNYGRNGNTSLRNYDQETESVSTGLRTCSPPTHSGDSDELSSLDGYPISSSQSSRRGVSSKLSSDSAYGSLSRQRSSELPITPRTPYSQRSVPRPLTGSTTTNTTMDVSPELQYNQRSRNFSGGSTSSGSPPPSATSSSTANPNLISNANYQQQQQHYQTNTSNLNQNNTNNNNNNEEPSENVSDGSGGNGSTGTTTGLVMVTPTQSMHSMGSTTSMNSMNPAMSSSMKMSKFCHECGAKFIIEHAKFCMDCGVKRVVL